VRPGSSFPTARFGHGSTFSFREKGRAGEVEQPQRERASDKLPLKKRFSWSGRLRKRRSKRAKAKPQQTRREYLEAASYRGPEQDSPIFREKKRIKTKSHELGRGEAGGKKPLNKPKPIVYPWTHKRKEGTGPI